MLPRLACVAVLAHSAEAAWLGGGKQQVSEPLTRDTINPRVLAAEYAVRGRLLDKAIELEKAGRQVVKCNIGNPQALGQRPLSWVRQILSLVLYSELLEAAEAAHASSGRDGAALRAQFPPDAVARARLYLDSIASVGAYSDSQGARVVREEVRPGPARAPRPATATGAPSRPILNESRTARRWRPFCGSATGATRRRRTSF
jgi:hypothetical protein